MKPFIILAGSLDALDNLWTGGGYLLVRTLAQIFHLNSVLSLFVYSDEHIEALLLGISQCALIAGVILLLRTVGVTGKIRSVLVLIRTGRGARA